MREQSVVVAAPTLLCVAILCHVTYFLGNCYPDALVTVHRLPPETAILSFNASSDSAPPARTAVRLFSLIALDWSVMI